MLEKELEILKLIEELYHGDTTDEEMLDFAEKNQTKVQAWREAFAQFPLYEVTKAINHYYVKKSSKTRPNIAQITAILGENGAEKEVSKVFEKPVEDFAMRYMEQDKESGDMNWLVPHYREVGMRIRGGYYPFVTNIMNPSYADFRECMIRYSNEIWGRDYQFESKNDIEKMSLAEKRELEARIRSLDYTNFLKKLN